jgi:hypothetical protein
LIYDKIQIGFNIGYCTDPFIGPAWAIGILTGFLYKLLY